MRFTLPQPGTARFVIERQKMTSLIKTTTAALTFIFGGAAAFAYPIHDGLNHLPSLCYSDEVDQADDATEVAHTCFLCKNCCNGGKLA